MTIKIRYHGLSMNVVNQEMTPSQLLTRKKFSLSLRVTGTKGEGEVRL